MEITEVRVSPIEGDEKLKGFATVIFDNEFVVRDLKIISGQKGLFVAMPSRKMKDGSFKDVAHPLNNDMRQRLEKAVLEEYEKAKEAKQQEEQQ
ncbi:septation regulator SpoVG [Hippea alviniae]|uniref:septation regulator SpoVG n=1 Tax=Hippea alviniae TaxID=1279027 RepID=UPI0003B3F575|nr:septation regulator SpoVG [Hippea alviniae]